MCDYCQGTKSNVTYGLKNITVQYKIKDGILQTEVEWPDIRLLSIGLPEVMHFKGNININYCPWCGRNLQE